MKYDNHKRPRSLKAWEDHLLTAALGASREEGIPAPATLAELLAMVEAAIMNHPTMAAAMSAMRDDISELIRLKARQKKLLKMPIPQRLLNLLYDEGAMSIDEVVERCASGDYGKISENVARAVFARFLALGLVEACPNDGGSEQVRNTIH